MPRKVRQLRAELRKAGFVWRPGKGSHGVWEHPRYPQVVVSLSGHDGADAKRYQEDEVREALTLLKSLQEAERQ
jgi:predicted RNA binding protein YcfA (HicA-like mRNA interferase family)